MKQTVKTITEICRNGVNGFTLMEILVAVVIFAVIMTTLYSAFNSVILSGESIKAKILESQQIQVAVDRIASDLKSICISQPPRYKKPDFESQADPFRFLGEIFPVGGKPFSRLMFASFDHISFESPSQKGVSRILYFIRVNNEKQYDLCRTDRLTPYPDFDEIDCAPVLLKNISRFEIQYFGLGNEMKPEWDSESKHVNYLFPHRIKIIAEFIIRGNLIAQSIELTLPVQRSPVE